MKKLKFWLYAMALVVSGFGWAKEEVWLRTLERLRLDAYGP